MYIANPIYKSDQGILKQVQRRTTKCIWDFYNISCPSWLEKLNLPSLTYRQKRGDMIMAFKLLNYKEVIPSVFQP